MKRISWIKQVILAALCLVSSAVAQQEAFQAQLDLAGMTFQLPEGYTVVDQDRYDLVIRSQDQSLEIRYTVNSLEDEMEVYRKAQEPGSQSVSVNPNTLPGSLVMVAAANISQTPPDPEVAGAFPADAVKEEFGADSGLTAFVPIRDPEFSTDYQVCLINIIHKNDIAYATAMALANDAETIRNVYTRDDVFHALRFK